MPLAVVPPARTRPPDGPLTWSDGSLTPDAMAQIGAEVAGRRGVIVGELGSGFSTIALARRLHARRGRLTAVEHDPRWARRVRTELEIAGLERVARVVGDASQLPPQIDVLVADGPFADVSERLAPSVVVFLGTVDPSAIDAWERTTGLRFTREAEARLSVARR